MKKTNKKVKKKEIILQQFNFPEHSLTISAVNQKEALKKLNKILREKVKEVNTFK